MFKKVITFVFITTLSIFSMAAEESTESDGAGVLTDLDLPPLNDKSRQFGYNPFPVVQCPAVDTKYTELLSDLQSLKDKLKEEGCKNEKKELASFEEILGKGRKGFVALVKKGQSSELKKTEIDAVKGYVDKVVRKTAKLSRLVNNPSCFAEDNIKEKQSLLGIMAVAIDSTAGVLGKLSGPWGLKLKLGGKFAAGLLKSIDTVIKENKAYDFGDFGTFLPNVRFKSEKDYRETRLYGHQDRILYVTSLCAYYKLKEELDEYSDPWAAKELYENFKENANKQLDFYESKCTDCAKIIQDYRGKISSNITFQDPSVMSGSGIPQLITHKKNFRKMSWRQLNKEYSEQVKGADAAFETSSGRGLGHKTIRSLTTLMWSELQLERIAKVTEEDSDDQALDAVVFNQEQVEEFLVDQEASNFIENRFEAAEFHFSYMKWYASKNFSKLRSLLRKAFGPNRGPVNYTDILFPRTSGDLSNQHISNIHWVYGDVDFAEVVTKEIVKEQSVNKGALREAQAFRRQIKTQLRKKIGHTYRAYSAGKKFCRFFLKGYLGSGRNNSISYECEQGHTYSQNIRDFMKILEKTSVAARQGDLIGRFNRAETVTVTDVNGQKEKVELTYTRNWVESLSGYVLWSLKRPIKEVVSPIGVNPELESGFKNNIGIE